MSERRMGGRQQQQQQETDITAQTLKREKKPKIHGI
jgi:hypothetical protein